MKETKDYLLRKLPIDLHTEIKKMAAEKQTSVRDLIIEAMTAMVKKHKGGS